MEKKKWKSLVWKADSATPKTIFTAARFCHLKQIKDIKIRVFAIITK